MAVKIPQKYISRQAEITELFIRELNKHMDDFMAGRVHEMYHIKDIAGIMCLHPVHVSNVVKLFTGHHPCFFFEERIVAEAKTLLANPAMSISNVASRLTYDTSNFTKFFKEYTGITPSAYRKSLAGANEKRNAVGKAGKTMIQLVA